MVGCLEQRSWSFPKGTPWVHVPSLCGMNSPLLDETWKDGECASNCLSNQMKLNLKVFCNVHYTSAEILRKYLSCLTLFSFFSVLPSFGYDTRLICAQQLNFIQGRVIWQLWDTFSQRHGTNTHETRSSREESREVRKEKDMLRRKRN